MSLRELESLVAVADKGSITAAAESLFLSVPAVSAHIAGMEATLRTKLLDRRHKPARLNAAGVLLCERARGVLRAYRDFYTLVAEDADLAGHLTLGASPTVLTSVIPRTLVALHATHPGLQIQLRYGRARNLLRKLQHGEIDALICSESPESLGDIEWTPFAEEPVVVIAPPQAQAQHDADLLTAYPYIRFGAHTWIGEAIEQHLASRGIVTRQVAEVDSREAIALMVRHGLGVSILPDSVPSLARLYGLRAVLLGQPPMTRQIGLAAPEDSPKQPLISALFQILRSCAEQERAELAAGS